MYLFDKRYFHTEIGLKCRSKGFIDKSLKDRTLISNIQKNKHHWWTQNYSEHSANNRLIIQRCNQMLDVLKIEYNVLSWHWPFYWFWLCFFFKMCICFSTKPDASMLFSFHRLCEVLPWYMVDHVRIMFYPIRVIHVYNIS